MRRGPQGGEGPHARGFQQDMRLGMTAIGCFWRPLRQSRRRLGAPKPRCVVAASPIAKPDQRPRLEKKQCARLCLVCGLTAVFPCLLTSPIPTRSPKRTRQMLHLSFRLRPDRSRPTGDIASAIEARREHMAPLAAAPNTPRRPLDPSAPLPYPRRLGSESSWAQMAELVDAPVSGTGAARRGGSSPLLGTICSFFHDLQ